MSTNVLPVLPTGYNESGQRIKIDVSSLSRSCVSSDVSEVSDPVPVLPPGFNVEGKKIDDVSEYISSKDPVHPNHGLMPASSPQTESTIIQTVRDEEALAELNLIISSLRAELASSQDRVQEYETEFTRLRKMNDDLRTENGKLKNANNRLESFVRVVTGKDTPDGPGTATTPHPKMGNWSAPQNPSLILSNSKRSTDPSIHSDMLGYMVSHRQSEPNMLSVPTRPNKLPLNKKMVSGARTYNSQPNSYNYDHSPVYQRSSPNVDYYYSSRGVQKKHSSSRDDLTSGGEDGSSMKSFDSGSSNGNVILSSQQVSTTETIV